MIVLCHLQRKKVFPVGQVQEDLAALLPNLANQMRGLLSNLYLAASQAIPAEAREQDPVLDAKAAVLDQSFYRLLRLVNSLSSAEYLAAAQPAALRDADLVKLIGEVCESAGDLAEMLGIHLKFICAMERRICAVHAGAMEQLLYHLLSNALKFTPAGGTVTVELKKSRSRWSISLTAICIRRPYRAAVWVWDCPYAAPLQSGTAAASLWNPFPDRAAASPYSCRTGSPARRCPM